MKAILLCAGFSKRLRPLTINTPKCLINFGETNLLDYWINVLVSAGVKKILINTHFHHQKIRDFVLNHKYKENVVLVYEKKILGTAGTLLKNLNFFGKEEGILIHGDNFMQESLKNFILQHKKRPTNCLMSMLTFKTRYPNSCGIVERNQNKILINFHEKPDKFLGNIANGAIYCISYEMLNELKKINNNLLKDFSTEIIPKYFNKIFCIHTNKYFTDIGDIKNLNYLKLKNRFNLKIKTILND